MTISLPERLRAVMALDPSAAALEFEDAWRPWSSFEAATAGLDEVLVAHGVCAGRPVGVVMRNRPEVAQAIAAVLATGRCVTTLSGSTPAGELAGEIGRLALPAVLIGRTDWAGGMLADATTAAGGVAVRMEDSPERHAAEVLAPPVGRPIATSTVEGVAVQMLTSGTTGPPKRVNLTYRNLELELESTASYSRSDDMHRVALRSGTTILWAPLLHIGGMRSLIASLVAGRKVALLERFEVTAWAELVRRHRPRAVSLAPTAMRMVLDSGLDRSALEGVRAVTAGTAPLAPEVADEFVERFGVPVLVVYGATEFGGGVAGWTLADWERFGTSKRGSVGRANRGVTLRVVDPGSGDEVARGAEGMLEVLAPQIDADGWVRTTDLARMDDDGFVWIVGRADDVVIRGGFKVSTGAVRDVLLSHPGVIDAAVVGIDDHRLGQVPVAAVELRPGEDRAAAPGAIRVFLRERLSPYQVPVDVKIVDRLPRTPSMKVSQPQVRDLFEVTGDG